MPTCPSSMSTHSVRRWATRCATHFPQWRSAKVKSWTAAWVDSDRFAIRCVESLTLVCNNFDRVRWNRDCTLGSISSWRRNMSLTTKSWLPTKLVKHLCSRWSCRLTVCWRHFERIWARGTLMLWSASWPWTWPPGWKRPSRSVRSIDSVDLCSTKRFGRLVRIWQMPLRGQFAIKWFDSRKSQRYWIWSRQVDNYTNKSVFHNNK